MQKLYYHGAVVIEEGRSVCSMCGVDVDDTLLSTRPCSIPTAYYVVFDDLPEFKDIYWVINVSNCKATLLAGRCVPGGMRYGKVAIKDKYLQEQMEDILLASVEENGGARNISGLHGISDDLAHVLKSWLTDGKIIIPEVLD